MALRVDLGEKSYDVIVARGSLSRAGELLDLGRKVLVVTDDGVPSAYARTVAAQCKEPCLVTLPAGEASKSLASFEQLCRAMLRHGMSRSDCVVAVGGGMVGDLAGFAAASFMRGVDFYNIPTTLLSQVDSSIGGKVAIDMDGIKNCVGAFYQPAAVLIDPEVLSTLSPRLLAEGMAEAVKMALTFDAAFFGRMERSEATLDEIILRSLELKRDTVEQDEREQGLRQVLNFGHTIGHGIESVSGLYHGECVALGMLPMCAPLVRKRLEPVLTGLGLPTALRGYDTEAVWAAMCHDKKKSGSGFTVIFVPEAGRFERKKLSEGELYALVKEALA
ncbi:MAG: 3-dehydroquinate synthase [Oscillospiraceae bacterium]|nr:3-dehydroquinate synthase [Oscillospiraceae bacterium]